MSQSFFGGRAFHLNYTFDSQYQIVNGSTQNLMDYTAGTDLVKHQWDAIHDPGLVIGMFEKDEDAAMMKTNILIKPSTALKNNVVSGNILGLEGQLIVMNDPDNNIIVEINSNIEKAAKVEWSFIDPNDNNAFMIEAYQNGSIKLGKKGDNTALYWEQFEEYMLTRDNKANLAVYTQITNSKSIVRFKPSSVGGDDFIIIANIIDKDGKTIKKVESQLLTVVRSIKFESLYNMRNIRSLINYTSSGNIQRYFKDAFIIYEAPVTSIKLSENYSIKYIAQYDRNNAITHEFKWTDLAAPIDYNPSIRKSNGNLVSTEKLTEYEKSNCSGQSVKDKADSWKNRLLISMNECLNNWMSDVGFENAIVSIEAFHIMFGNNRDPDMNYNPFMPCTSVPITIRGFTTFVGAGYWSFRGAVGGVNLGKGITAIPSWVEGDDDISNVIAHEIAHTTNDIVNSKPIMYRVEFGNGDHSTTSGEGLVEPQPYKQGGKIDFSDIEIKILRGYKQ